ncbi:hypothetical protein CC79DRAFT_1322701 [Sarocladium strictum]
MDKAKQTISSFMSHNNEHKTSVDQDQRAAITEEHVRPQRHEEVTTAIDKEIHQDHHQTIIQPIKHTEQLAEKHTHNAAPVQHKTFEHDKLDDAKAMQDADVARYRDTSVTHDTINTTSKAPVVQGEHIHHHLHQHVQPVIQKDTIAPEVVHTTIPIHETHHAPTVSHGTTTMPVKTIDEFEQQHGGLFKGKQTATLGEFDGCAKTFIEGDKNALGSGTGVASTTTTTGTSTTTGTGTTGQRVKSLVEGGSDERTTRSGAGLKDSSSTDYKIANQAAKTAYNDASVPRSSAPAAAAAPGVAAPGNTDNLRTSTTNTSTGSKISLKDKLNPFKDADGDGKKGIMS